MKIQVGRLMALIVKYYNNAERLQNRIALAEFNANSRKKGSFFFFGRQKEDETWIEFVNRRREDIFQHRAYSCKGIRELYEMKDFVTAWMNILVGEPADSYVLISYLDKIAFTKYLNVDFATAIRGMKETY